MVAEGPMPKPPEPIVIVQGTTQEEEPVPLDEDGLPPPVLRSPDERSNEPVGQNKPTSRFVLLLLFLAFALVFGTMFYPLYSWMILDGDEFNWPAAIVLGGLVLAVFSSAVKYGKMNTFDRHTSRRNPLRRKTHNQRTETDLAETPWTGLLGPNYETGERISKSANRSDMSVPSQGTAASINAVRQILVVVYACVVFMGLFLFMPVIAYALALGEFGYGDMSGGVSLIYWLCCMGLATSPFFLAGLLSGNAGVVLEEEQGG